MQIIPVSRPSIGEEELNAIRPIFDSGWLGMGSTVYEFEQCVSEFINAKHVVCTNSGTSALHLALSSLGIGPGDEVIVPAFTFVATIQAISATGAKPIFCDIRRNDLNIDPDDIVHRITDRTKAILPVHYRGIPCDLDQIHGIAREHNLMVIEDAAHAFGSSYNGKKIGSLSDMTCFSFDPIKAITCGEGGAVSFQNTDLLEKVQQKRILGIDKDTWSRYKNERSWFYDVVSQGYRYHMSNINAAIGCVQIKKINRFNEKKISVAAKYDAAFRSIKGITLLKNNDYKDVSLFAYVILVDKNRDRLMEYLLSNGVGCGVHYIPSHLFSYYHRDGLQLPVTDEIYNKILTLPLFADITDDEVNTVIETVIEGISVVNNG